MSHILHRQTVSFIVRVWAEYLEQDSPLWRSKILSPDGSQRTCFQTLDDITSFIDSHTPSLQINKEPEHEP